MDANPTQDNQISSSALRESAQVGDAVIDPSVVKTVKAAYYKSKLQNAKRLIGNTELVGLDLQHNSEISDILATSNPTEPMNPKLTKVLAFDSDDHLIANPTNSNYGRKFIKNLNKATKHHNAQLVWADTESHHRSRAQRIKTREEVAVSTSSITVTETKAMPKHDKSKRVNMNL